jgi:hypothetical protein
MPARRNLSAVWILHLLTLLVVVCFVAMPTAAQYEVLGAEADAVVNKFISGQEAELGGKEYEGARKFVAGDLNHDGVSDLVVLYTIEGAGGGNSYTQYLAVFVRLEEKLTPTAHTVVGGKGYRAAHLEGIADNVISLTTLSYGPHDAMCCPSIKGSARFVLADGKLVSQPSPPPSPKLRQ